MQKPKQNPRFSTAPGWIAFAVAVLLAAGCASIREARHGCALLVIVDGGKRLASPAQLERLERRVEPLLAERGLVLSHDPRNAGWLARVEFQSDPDNPLEGDFSIRTIEPNPTDIPRTATDGLDGYRRAQDQSFQRQEQQLMQESRKTTP